MGCVTSTRYPSIWCVVAILCSLLILWPSPYDDGVFAFRVVMASTEDTDDTDDEKNHENGGIEICESITNVGGGSSNNRSPYNEKLLKDPCQEEMNQQAPSQFSLAFETNHYGIFTATCVRDRAPIWVDRVWNLAKAGYYNENYFFRVLPGFVVQFGTAGDPAISNIYNYTSSRLSECAILQPQPPDMPYCMATGNNENSSCPVEGDAIGQSNTYGTIAMSTSYNEDLEEYPHGVTWNATAELFINIGNNQRLDKNLFVPICTISKEDMTNVVTKFPSFGEVSDLGGHGPSLGKLYELGNSYIESNEEWSTTMAKTGRVDICTNN